MNGTLNIQGLEELSQEDLISVSGGTKNPLDWIGRYTALEFVYDAGYKAGQYIGKHVEMGATKDPTYGLSSWYYGR